MKLAMFPDSVTDSQHSINCGELLKTLPWTPCTDMKASSKAHGSFWVRTYGRVKFLSICTNYLIAFGKSAFKGEYGMAIILCRMQQAIYCLPKLVVYL